VAAELRVGLAVGAAALGLGLLLVIVAVRWRGPLVLRVPVGLLGGVALLVAAASFHDAAKTVWAERRVAALQAQAARELQVGVDLATIETYLRQNGFGSSYDERQRRITAVQRVAGYVFTVEYLRLRIQLDENLRLAEVRWERQMTK
jgi:hypothetical protein